MLHTGFLSLSFGRYEWDCLHPSGSYISLLSHQRVTLFERIIKVRRCGLVGENVSLGWALRLLKLIPSLQSISAYEWGRSSQLLQYLPACFHTFHHDDNGLTFETISKPQFKHFLLYEHLFPLSLHINTTVTKKLTSGDRVLWQAWPWHLLAECGLWDVG